MPAGTQAGAASQHAVAAMEHMVRADCSRPRLQVVAAEVARPTDQRFLDGGLSCRQHAMHHGQLGASRQARRHTHGGPQLHWEGVGFRVWG